MNGNRLPGETRGLDDAQNRNQKKRPPSGRRAKSLRRTALSGLILLLLASMNGCFAYKPVETAGLKPAGDFVRFRWSDGRRVTLSRARVVADSLEGMQQTSVGARPTAIRFALDSIVDLEARRFDAPRTTLLGFVVVVGGIILVEREISGLCCDNFGTW